MIDEDLRNKAIQILEDEQSQFTDALSPQTGLTAPDTITAIETERNQDGTITEKVTEESTNYLNENVDYEYRLKFSDDAYTLQQFCKIVDDKIISINAQINSKKQEIVTLSTEATTGNCWPGIGYSTDNSISTNYSQYVVFKNDIENLRIYPKVAGPDVNYKVENPFEPDEVNELTSSYSGYGYKNLPDKVSYKNKDGTLTGLGTDGSGALIGDGRFDVSTTLTDHNARIVSAVPTYRFYFGTISPTTPSRCVAIANSITTLYNEIIDLKNQRDSLRTDLNTIKENKSEKELSAWGIKRLDQALIEEQTKNASTIAAIKGFNSDVTVNVEALVLNLDVGDPDSYTGIGTNWYDLSGNGNHALLYPSSSTPEYEYSDGYYLTFNENDGTNQYAQTGIKTTNILGIGNTWTVETWFKVNGTPYDNFVGVVTSFGNIGIASTAITGIATAGISIGQYVRSDELSGIVGSATTVVGIATTNGGTVYISPASLNTVGLSSVSFVFGTYSYKFGSFTNAIIDLNASNTKTNLLSVVCNQDGIFSGITTNSLVYTTSETGISTTHLVGTAITNGSWYHGVVVRNDTENTKLYINGNLVSTYTGSFPLGTASTTSVKIAAWTDEPVYSNVSISVVKLYQKTYTDDDIKNKFDSSKGRYNIVG